MFGRVCVQWASRSTCITVDIDANTLGFSLPDVVHLSSVGLGFYLDILRDANMQFL
ncbi:hypothetical protein DPMN_169522 [Dreissena polymorpha]|uniref:Uncharacterized protein n=1 Tax=Dreissena polymorpha TaxID=45954 RepID=A0A9D4DWX1_DREPO|nr:hypothetical protein DPMN_169522 [Dreissena polymorpha]